MAPTRKDGPPKSKGKGASTVEDSQKEALQFGYPQPLVAALQAIAARSTAGLFKDLITVPADRTAQQLAQSHANVLDRLGKRLNGNARAKIALRDAATAWIGRLGQHLVALSARLQNVAERLDSDQNEAIAELQAATMNLGASTGDQVNQALNSLGPVWTAMQEAELLRIATALRAFSSVGAGASGSQGGLAPLASSSVRMFFARADLLRHRLLSAQTSLAMLQPPLPRRGLRFLARVWIPRERTLRPRGGGTSGGIGILALQKARGES